MTQSQRSLLMKHALSGPPLVAGYLGLVAGLTWPLAGSAWSSLPAVRFTCFFDMYYSAWVLSHESHALVSSATRFADANIYHPVANGLFYGPAALGALPLFAPVFLTTGNPALALNVTFLLGLALTGAAMHMVVRRWTASDLAGAVGAVTVLLNQWLLWGFVPSAPHWAALYCLPLIAYLAATRLESVRSVVLLGALVTLQCLTDLVYVAPAVLTPLGVLAVLRLARPATRPSALRLVGALALAVIMLAPVYRGYVAVRAANPQLAEQTNWIVTASLSPSMLPADLFGGNSPFLVTSVAIGLIVLGLIAMILRRRSGSAPPVPGGWAHGALWAIVGCCLALNATALIGGTTITTPLGYLLRRLPSLHAIRMPARMGVAGLVGLGILSGVAFGEVAAVLRTHLRGRAVGQILSSGLAVIVFVLVYRAYVSNYWDDGPRAMPAAYAIQPTPKVPRSFLPLLLASKTPLLELPIDRRITFPPPAHALAMYHSISHWRPLLNGYSSYWPAGFTERMAQADRLPDVSALERLVADTGLSLIWVHLYGYPQRQRKAWLSPPPPTPERPGLFLVAREGRELLFVVRPASGTAAPRNASLGGGARPGTPGRDERETSSARGSRQAAAPVRQ